MAVKSQSATQVESDQVLPGESDLLVRLKAGDSQAVQIWFEQYQAELHTYIAFKVSQPKDVEELVQETFINCLKHLPVFDGRSSIATWMKSIARHEIADYYRKKYAKKALQTLPLKTQLIGQLAESAHHDAHQVSQVVAEALKKIRSDYRELLLMKYVDGKKVAVIARELGRTLKSIEADLYRAREAFKVAYAQVATG